MPAEGSNFPLISLGGHTFLFLFWGPPVRRGGGPDAMMQDTQTVEEFQSQIGGNCDWKCFHRCFIIILKIILQ